MTSSNQADGVVQSHPLVLAPMVQVTTSYNKLQQDTTRYNTSIVQLKLIK